MRVDEAQLSSIVNNVRAGARSLDQVARGLPDAVNAGFSSDVANAALARVGKAALALAQQGDTLASNVNAAKGSYTATEHENKKKLDKPEDYNESDVNRRRAQEENARPLEDAGDEPGEEEYKNEPPPTTETAPAPTPPPEPTG
ncbi:MAG: hypothetical protein GEU98_28705 [Pseudonocardiaceae bacterium]|nr:hypothetical protein [Pseudonocardiaceae bacterium]